ncbi:DUF4258 domain-containing protein [Rudanella lutea]|uniref:DUF4258 domain-containing protein n=1 Tax=Rudanella lutea TaxID=451374 RepID=UPI00036D73C9|nr:DUF4258 domain-containing protein [Rudanella lutea]
MDKFDYKLSVHASEQAQERGISELVIHQVLRSPEQIVDDESGVEGQKVFQSRIIFDENRTYLVRVFVNISQNPAVVKTVYKTSQISKYYHEG